MVCRNSCPPWTSSATPTVTGTSRWHGMRVIMPTYYLPFRYYPGLFSPYGALIPLPPARVNARDYERVEWTEELDKGRWNGCLLIKSSSEITYDFDEDVIETRRWHILINVVWLVLFIYLFQHLSREFCQGNPNPLQSPHRRDCMNILIFYSCCVQWTMVGIWC